MPMAAAYAALLTALETLHGDEDAGEDLLQVAGHGEENRGGDLEDGLSQLIYVFTVVRSERDQERQGQGCQPAGGAREGQVDYCPMGILPQDGIVIDQGGGRRQMLSVADERALRLSCGP